MRLIDADALLKQLAEVVQKASEDAKYSGNRISELTWDMAVKYIKNAPTIEPEQKQGKWIENKNGTWSCTLCHSWIPNEQHYYAKYCLHCGAEMLRPNQATVYVGKGEKSDD